MISYLNTSLIVILIILVVVAILYLKKKNDGDVYNKSEHEKLNDDLVDKLKKETEAIETDLKNLQTSFANSLSDVSKNVGENKGIIESKSTEILAADQRLVDNLTGSKRSGTTGELFLEHLFKNSGLVYEKQWVKNKSIEKEGTTLSVEFAIIHPTGLAMPVDSHWPITSYENLLKLRKEQPTPEIEKEKEDLFKKIVKSYGDKAKEVQKKYIDSPLSAGFACIYIPSESLYLEITTHINSEKELWISRVQSSTKVTFMGPSTFAAYCSALLLGFNSIEVDQKAKNFMKHLESLNSSVIKLHEETITHENNMKRVYTSAQSVSSAAEKIKTKMEKVEEEINNIEEHKN